MPRSAKWYAEAAEEAAGSDFENRGTVYAVLSLVQVVSSLDQHLAELVVLARDGREAWDRDAANGLCNRALRRMPGEAGDTTCIRPAFHEGLCDSYHGDTYANQTT